MQSLDKKRARSQNWDDLEKNVFLESIKSELGIIENKKKLTVLNKDKNAAWERISQKMEVQGFARDSKRMKEQWQRMKVQAKKNISMFRKYRSGTGGGPPAPAPSEIDWKIKDLLPQEFVEDISQYDSDAIYNVAELKSPDIPIATVKEQVNFSDVSFATANTSITGPALLKNTITAEPQPFSPMQDENLEEDTGNEDFEEIHFIVQPDERNTPRKSRTVTKKMTAYEEQLLVLNRKRMDVAIQQSWELHNLRMVHEREYHRKRMRLLDERKE